MIIDDIFFFFFLEKATESERRRVNYDLRTTADDQSQRILNVLLPGTQVPIHRHQDSTETIFVVSGRLTEIFYNEKGVECARHDLCPAEGRFGLQIPTGMWHTVIVKEPCVIFEAKDGAYKPLTSADVWNYE